ncbi:hypothetical protein AB0F92_38015 [Kitasatospora aureofaciens]|uniref:hypothetical protein n=1 Tax=Kitasatospora aureofaciens TaxID=1894 RepID=UPI0033D0E7D1
MLLAIRLLSHYVRHLIFQPYRRELEAERFFAVPATVGTRHQSAAADAVLEIIIRGYGRLAGFKANKTDGQIAVHYVLFASALDDEYERNLQTGEALVFSKIVTNARVREALHALVELLQRRVGCEVADLGLRLLTQDASDYYQCYVSQPSEGAEINFQELLSTAAGECSGYMIFLARLIGFAHGFEPSDLILKEFASLGMAAKLADDLKDIRLDVSRGCENLFHLQLKEYPDEHRRVVPAIHSKRRLNGRLWWLLAPSALKDYLAVHWSFRNQLATAQFRDAADLMLASALLRSTQKSGITGTRAVR